MSEPFDQSHIIQGKLISAQITPKPEGITSANHCKQQGGWITFPFITGTVLGLSLAAAGWASNIIVFLITELNMKTIKATQINNIVLGSNNLFPIAGAILADSFLGSFSVVTIFSFVSLVGVIMLTLIATIHSLRPPPCTTTLLLCKTPSKLQYSVLYGALALASIGLGGTRFTMAAMGADQFDKANDQGTFFNWFFLALYIANVISFTAIIYIEDNISWGLGFGVCVAANIIGLVFFLLGKRFYCLDKPKGSPFTSIARVIVAAIRKRKVSGSFGGEDYYFGSTGGSMAKRHFAPTKSVRFFNFASVKTDHDARSDGSYEKSWRLCTVEEVEDLKTLIKIVPLWSTGIFASIPLAMTSSLVVLQALTMDRHLGPHFKIPPGSFIVFNIISTTISIAIIDRLLVPAWQKLTDQPLMLLRRIGIGYAIDTIGIVTYALVEIRRLHLAKTHHLVGQSGSTVPMSALWLIFPLAIIGVGEGFHFPGQVALYYQEFPMSLRSTSTAMISLHIGIGFYASTAMTDLISRITGWLPDNINEGRLDNVFWLLAVIEGVNFGYYLVCAKLFKYQNGEKYNDEPSEPDI